jgi:hypothetical protein
MKKLVVLAAFALGIGMTPASACDWGHHATTANATPVTACDSRNCAAEAATQATEETAATKTEPTAPPVAEESARPAPTIVACETGNC